ncbi:MAG TPA: DUF5916 domain-containing protein [Thermoanaerobaculia bacterium]|jgi:hypothetical protein|nr:DUF5916 domain-containing protein [Thermoanaerobaculia bacterium]
MSMRRSAHLLLLSLALPLCPLAAQQAPEPAASPEPAEEIRVSRAAGPIEVDGVLGDPGWSGATPYETFYETNPGDNVEPKVKTVAWITHDDDYLYAAFEFSDPEPGKIRAPYSDRDDVPGSTDYGGIILDTRNDGKTGFMFLVNPSNIQYDAVNSDASGEDSAPDFYWDSAARVGPQGWTLEIRIPFSSLRYESGDVQDWGVLLYRNYPRDFRYQMFSSRLPRGSNCFICHQKKLTGLAGLPSGNHLVLAPYGAGRRDSFPENGRLGNRLTDETNDWDLGLDAKWTPDADNAIDLTINPDFSQVESDVAQITANERFALSVPEKRPFFLEGADLLASPLALVYTRSITSPRWGARATGELGGNTLYTVLVGDDQGGGLAILPGPQASSFALQDYSSRVALGRIRRDYGRSFVSVLFTDREIDGSDGGGHNRVIGPGILWRPNRRDSYSFQFLYSDTENPNRPDLTRQWTGQSLTSHALYGAWVRNTRTYDWAFQYYDIGDDFRADVGFIPQVGIRDGIGTVGWTFFPKEGPFRRIRPFLRTRYVSGTGGDLLVRRLIPGVQLSGLWSSSVSLEGRQETLRVGRELFDYSYFVGSLSLSPSQKVADLSLDLTLGEAADVVNARLGNVATIALEAIVRPTDHLALQLIGSRRTLDVSPTGTGARDRRLFTAEVSRLKATYTFNSRSYLRLIGQRTRTERDRALYTVPVRAQEDEFNGSALFAYKLNWQTVLFLGYGDDREQPLASDELKPAQRRLFFKISYAFQR